MDKLGIHLVRLFGFGFRFGFRLGLGFLVLVFCEHDALLVKVEELGDKAVRFCLARISPDRIFQLVKKDMVHGETGLDIHFDLIG